MYSMYNNSAAAHAYLILRYDLKVSIKLQYNLVIIILEIYHPVGSYPDRIERLSLIRIVNNRQLGYTLDPFSKILRQFSQ